MFDDLCFSGLFTAGSVTMALSAVYLPLGKEPMETALFCIISVALAGKMCEIICSCRLNQGIMETKRMVLMVLWF